VGQQACVPLCLTRESVALDGVRSMKYLASCVLSVSPFRVSDVFFQLAKKPIRKGAGKTGLWTKSDGVIYFDAFQVSEEGKK
jgi:hypothetical protein